MTKLTLSIVKLYHLIQEGETKFVRVEAKMHGKHLFLAYQEDMLESLEVLIRRNEYNPETLNLAETLEQFLTKCLNKYDGAVYVGIQGDQVAISTAAGNQVLHTLTTTALVASADFTSKAAADISKAINDIQEALKGRKKEALPMLTHRRNLLASALDATICEGKPVLVFNVPNSGIVTTNRILSKQLVSSEVVDNIEYLVSVKGYDNLKISLLGINNSTAEILLTEQLTEQRIAIISYNTGTGKTEYKHIWYNLKLVPLTFFDFPDKEVNSEYLKSTYAFVNIPRAEQVPAKE